MVLLVVMMGGSGAPAAVDGTCTAAFELGVLLQGIHLNSLSRVQSRLTGPWLSWLTPTSRFEQSVVVRSESRNIEFVLFGWLPIHERCSTRASVLVQRPGVFVPASGTLD